MMDAAIPNMAPGYSSRCVCLEVISSADIARRQFSSSFASMSSTTPLSTRSLHVSSPATTLVSMSWVSRGLPFSATIRGLMTLPALRLT